MAGLLDDVNLGIDLGLPTTTPVAFPTAGRDENSDDGGLINLLPTLPLLGGDETTTTEATEATATDAQTATKTSGNDAGETTTATDTSGADPTTTAETTDGETTTATATDTDTATAATSTTEEAPTTTPLAPSTTRTTLATTTRPQTTAETTEQSTTDIIESLTSISSNTATLVSTATTPTLLTTSSTISSTGTAIPQADGTDSNTNTGSGGVSLPTTTIIGISAGAGGLFFLLAVIFLLRRVLRSRREGNKQALERLEFTYGSSAAPNMTQSNERLNDTWNAGLNQYHEPSMGRPNAKGLGYSM